MIETTSGKLEIIVQEYERFSEGNQWCKAIDKIDIIDKIDKNYKKKKKNKPRWLSFSPHIKKAEWILKFF